jgi:uncharacterized lipoprotein YddW (UPF0748 family)
MRFNISLFATHLSEASMKKEAKRLPRNSIQFKIDEVRERNMRPRAWITFNLLGLSLRGEGETRKSANRLHSLNATSEKTFRSPVKSRENKRKLVFTAIFQLRAHAAHTESHMNPARSQWN